MGYNIPNLARLAEDHGWQVWNTSEYGRVSYTYGIQDTACLYVRFGHQGRIVNAIYIHFPTGNRDQYICGRERRKLERIQQTLRDIPETLPA